MASGPVSLAHSPSAIQSSPPMKGSSPCDWAFALNDVKKAGIDFFKFLCYSLLMSEKAEFEGGFNGRRAPQDPLVAELLEKHGLPQDASLQEIEPVVVQLWENVGTRLTAAEMVLGRRVDGSEPNQNPLLRETLLTDDPAYGFASLFMLRDLEESQAEQ